MHPEDTIKEAVNFLKDNGYLIKSPDQKNSNQKMMLYFSLGLAAAFVVMGHVTVIAVLTTILAVPAIPLFFITIFKTDERKKSENWCYIILSISVAISTVMHYIN